MKILGKEIVFDKLNNLLVTLIVIRIIKNITFHRDTVFD